ncbi:MAG: rhomboid family protein [Verrucomicrobiota bacterium]
MSAIAQTRCLNHGNREAVARCPECEKFFCRECITEHDGRVICQSCLSDLIATDDAPSSNFVKNLARTIGAAMGFAIAWVFFYLLGRILISIPTEFHDGGMWDR